MQNHSLVINQRSYTLPKQPVVVICIDGNQPEYFEAAISHGRAPFIASLFDQGFNYPSKCVVPSFTNPNNMSIITGAPPSRHGICGNFYFDGEQDVMMTDPKLLKIPSILESFHQAGEKVIAITAKDKLRAMLSKGLDFSTGRAICFSTELANKTTLAGHGIDNAEQALNIPTPDVYSAELSEYVFRAGVQLLEQEKPALMYLTTTDYIQHTYAPEGEGALSFYAMLDQQFAALSELGARLVITADHGMNAKTDAAGKPNIIYLDDLIASITNTETARTVLPITDPYVAHHGALGSFAAIYVDNTDSREAIKGRLLSEAGVAEVLEKSEAAERFELDPQRIGDLIVVSEQNYVIGKSADHHDLSQLRGTLRSHGGITEQDVPLVTNFDIGQHASLPLRNFDAYYLAMNA